MQPRRLEDTKIEDEHTKKISSSCIFVSFVFSWSRFRRIIMNRFSMRATIHVRPASPEDAPTWLQMRHALWPEGDAAEHAGEIERYFAGQLHEPLEVLLAIAGTSRIVGFAELSIRNYAEDCVTNRVAYLEGWYVVPDARRQGVGGALVAAAEQWGRSQGCTEFGSDTLIDNDTSAAAHLALGFEETARLRCFRKPL